MELLLPAALTGLVVKWDEARIGAFSTNCEWGARMILFAVGTGMTGQVTGVSELVVVAVVAAGVTIVVTTGAIAVVVVAVTSGVLTKGGTVLTGDTVNELMVVSCEDGCDGGCDGKGGIRLSVMHVPDVVVNDVNDGVAVGVLVADDSVIHADVDDGEGTDPLLMGTGTSD